MVLECASGVVNAGFLGLFFQETSVKILFLLIVGQAQNFNLNEIYTAPPFFFWGPGQTSEVDGPWKSPSWGLMGSSHHDNSHYCISGPSLLVLILPSLPCHI